MKQENGKQRFVTAVAALSKAFALAVPDPEPLVLRDDVGYFQAVSAALTKSGPGAGRSQEDRDHAVRQLVSRALAPGEVIDIFAAAALRKRDISILSDEFLAEVQGLPYRNLPLEVLRELLRNEIKVRSRRRVVQARSFAALLEQSLRRYQNRAIETAQVIEELIRLGKHMRDADRRGEEMGLNEEESAFYEALGVNDSAVAVLGNEKLRTHVRERNVAIDWTLRESVQAKRILNKYGLSARQAREGHQDRAGAGRGFCRLMGCVTRPYSCSRCGNARAARRSRSE